MQTKPVVIVGGARIPFVKSFSNYKELSNQEMLTSCLIEIVKKFKLKNKRLGEVALGAVIKHSSDWNMARECVLGSGLSANTPAVDLQKACGTGLEAVIMVANKIALGQIECGIAGGSDTNSDAPIALKKQLSRSFIDLSQARDWNQRVQVLKDFKVKNIGLQVPAVQEPRTGLSMGEHCELMVKKWNINRQEQDKLALESHQKAAKAYQEGFYKDQVFSYKGISVDKIVRSDSSIESLSKLRPAFDKTRNGTLTAGNSTPLTDGASVVFLCSEEYAKANDLPILAYFRDGQSAAVDFVNGAGLLMAPTLAVSELLERNQLNLGDLNFYEIHEAFAGQVLCTLKAWEDEKYCQETLNRSAPLGSIDRSNMNVKGGSLAIGHPFAATGGRIVTSLAKILSAEPGSKGLISICTAGGMGVAAILEGA